MPPPTQPTQSKGEQKTEPATTPIRSRAELKALFKNGRLPDESHFSFLIDSLVHKNDMWKKTTGGGNGNGCINHRIISLNRSWYAYIASQKNLVVSERDAVRLRLNINDRIDIR